MSSFSSARRIILSAPATTCIIIFSVVATALTMMLPGVHDAAVISTFIIIIALGTAGIALDPRPYSLCQIFSLFCLVFMGLAPMGQYISGIIHLAMLPFSRSAFLTANLLVIACQATFLLCARLRRKPERQIGTASPAGVSNPCLVTLALLATAFTIWHFRHSPTALFSRAAYHTAREDDGPMTVLFFDFIIRSIPAMCLTVGIMAKNRKKYAVGILAACALVAGCPTAVPRFQLATLGIMLLTAALPVMRKNKVLTLSLLLAIFIVFPRLNYFRNPETTFPMPYESMDFDCYQNLVAAIDSHFVTHGRQLTGVLLFFVPRALWPGKPVGSGYELARHLRLSYYDISMPFFGEGYINFGIAGAIIFTALLALGYHWLDRRFGTPALSYPHILYLIVLGHTIYLMRGSLMAAFSSLCCLAIAAAIVCFPAIRPKHGH